MAKHPGGRPTIFTPQLGTLICERISSGESLRAICREEKMPNISSVIKWINDLDKKEFSQQYEQACNARAELMFEELNEIADLSDGTESPNRSRLRVDTRKWYLSKVMPKKFGEKIDVTSGGKPIPILSNVPENNSNNQNTEAEQEN